MSDGYHEDGRIGATMLKMSVRSPWMYRDCYVTRVRKVPSLSHKPEVAFGTMVHRVLLEGAEIGDVARRIPEDCLKSNGHINPARLREYQLQHPGVEMLKEWDYERLEGVIEMARAHPFGALLHRYSSMQFERPIYWTDGVTGLECKAKPDMLLEGEDTVVCYDLKVSERVDPDGWGRTARSLMYWLQDMHYTAGLSSLTGKPVAFVFWVLESVYPYRIARYEYDEISRERASESYRLVMDRLAERLRENDWEEEWERKANTLTLNPWEVGAGSDGELEGFSEEGECDDEAVEG